MAMLPVASYTGVILRLAMATTKKMGEEAGKDRPFALH
jgi:hypothetical protein